VLYLFYLTKFPKKIARMWAVFYVLLNDVATQYPLFLVLTLTAHAIALLKDKTSYPMEKLKEAFHKLKTTGILRNTQISWEEIEKSYLIEERTNNLNLILKTQKPKKDRSKIILM